MPRVLCLTGWSYSGTTLLGRILGQGDGFVGVGEVRHIWRDGFLLDRPCGCGEPFSRCPFWTQVAGQACPGLDAERAHAEQEAFLRNANMLRRSPPKPRGQLELLRRLYAAIASVSGARVIVDTSKTPLYAELLRAVQGVELRVLHVVRDSRAILAARLRRGRGLPPPLDVVLWDVWHLAAERLRHEAYLRIRYEDFAREPRRIAEAAARLAGEPAASLPFRDDGHVVLGPSHFIRGNPNRSEQGLIEVVPDERWRTELGAGARLLTVAATWPLLLRYGYTR